MTNETLAQNLLDLVGGPDNITRATHCATRLRLVLKDEKQVQKEAIDNLDKVNGSVFAGGQYQIIIGLTVPQVYEAFTKAMGTSMTNEESPAEEEKEENNLFNRFFKSLVGIMTPTFGVMGAAGIMKGLLALVVAMGLMKTTDGAYQIWYAVAQSFFYFLPIWVGFNASKVFKGNQFIGAVIGASLVFPDIIALKTAGTAITFFGIPITLVDYTQSLFPAMLAAYVAAKVEKFFMKRIHETVSWMFTPLLTLLITVPLAFLVLGPVMTWVSNGLATVVMAIYNVSPILFGIIGGAFWQVVVVFGLHYAFIPVLINNVTNLGQDPINAVFQVTVFALAGAAIGFALKTKNAKNKSLGFSVGITGLIGITEPIIYSVALPFRRQFIYAFVGGGVAGAIQAIANARIYGFGNGGLMAFPLFINPKTNDLHSMYAFIIAAAVAFFIPIILNLVLGTGEKKKVSTK